MKKLSFIIVVEFVLAITSFYAIGYKSAKEDIMNNIIVTNQEKEKGFYIVKYENTEHKYWYE